MASIDYVQWVSPFHCHSPSDHSRRCGYERDKTLQWRHNGRDGVSNHQPHDYLLNRLFRRRSKKTSKLPGTGLCARNSPVTSEFQAQRPSNVENVSIWWRHPEMPDDQLPQQPMPTLNTFINRLFIGKCIKCQYSLAQKVLKRPSWRSNWYLFAQCSAIFKLLFSHRILVADCDSCNAVIELEEQVWSLTKWLSVSQTRSTTIVINNGNTTMIGSAPGTKLRPLPLDDGSASISLEARCYHTWTPGALPTSHELPLGVACQKCIEMSFLLERCLFPVSNHCCDCQEKLHRFCHLNAWFRPKYEREHSPRKWPLT